MNARPTLCLLWWANWKACRSRRRRSSNLKVACRRWATALAPGPRCASLSSRHIAWALTTTVFFRNVGQHRSTGEEYQEKHGVVLAPPKTSTKFAFDCSWYETKTNTNWFLKVKRQNFHSIPVKYYEKLRLPVILMTSTRVKKGYNGSFLKAGAYQNRCAMYK